MLENSFSLLEHDLEFKTLSSMEEASSYLFKKKLLLRTNSNQQVILNLVHNLLSQQLKQTRSFPLLTLKQLFPNQKNSLFSLFQGFLSTPFSKSSTSSLDFLKNLMDQKYKHLAQKTLNESDFLPPLQMSCLAFLIEQLTDLLLLCSDKNFSHTAEVINFTLFLIDLIPQNVSSSFDFKNSFDCITQLIGQLIYLLGKNPPLVLKIFHLNKEKEIIEQISFHFSQSLQEIGERLDNLFINHLHTNIQLPQLALNHALPLEIAHLLLTKRGSINGGLIPFISKVFISKNSYLINSEAHLNHVLQFLYHSPLFRTAFEKIPAPDFSNSLSREITKITLQKDSHEEMTAFHSRQMILSALLSHLRQGNTSSCFAVSLAIELLSSHLWYCLKDLIQLMQQGKLIRQINHVYKDIPSSQKINDEDLNKTLTFDFEGTLFVNDQKKGKLWQAPGINAACRSIGIDSSQKSIQKLLKTLFPYPYDQNFKHFFSVRQLIYKLCEQVFSSSSFSLEELQAKSCLAFSCQTSHPLLKIWENAIANMAEAEEGSLIKTKIIDVSLHALQFFLSQQKILPTPFLSEFFLTFQKKLHHLIELQYDPTIQNQKSKAGGFVLSLDQKRIDSPFYFRQFISTLIQESYQQIRKRLQKEDQVEDFKSQIQQLMEYCQTQSFMVYVLSHYHPINYKLISQLEKNSPLPYSDFLFTPWITQVGNNSKAVLKVYFENQSCLNSEIFIGKNAEELLVFLIDKCKKMKEEEKEFFIHRSHSLKPACVLGKHRFPLMIGDPSFIQSWQQTGSSLEWIEKQVKIPGNKIAQSEVTKSMQQLLIEELENCILPKFFSSSQLPSQINFLKNLPLAVTIQHCRFLILDYFKKSLLKINYLNELMRQVDTIFFEALDPLLKSQLENSAVHFADTNWSKDAQDIHFCFILNLGTGVIELAKCYANKTHIKALNQAYWFFDQPWEFLSFPLDLPPF